MRVDDKRTRALASKRKRIRPRMMRMNSTMASPSCWMRLTQLVMVMIRMLLLRRRLRRLGMAVRVKGNRRLK